MKLSKFNEIGRSLLTKCGVDAKIFLSDVYNKRTQAKKHQADAHQYGRSMVEMLGVLVIIGVLSVGAIAGYSKAMFKYKMNKTMDILSHVVARVAELETMNMGYSELYGKQAMIDYGVMPDCDVNYVDSNGDTESYCPLPLGEIMTSLAFDKYMFGEFYIKFLQEPFDSCVAFFTSGIYKNTPEEWWHHHEDYESGAFISVLTPNSSSYVYDRLESWPGAKSELSSQDILNACEKCKDSDYCTI